MTRRITFAISDIIPRPYDVLKAQDIPVVLPPSSLPESSVPASSDKIQSLLSKALDCFNTCAQPVGWISEISLPEFTIIFEGNGKNEPEAPLGHIFPSAQSLALFALTMGAEVSLEIERLFKQNDYALGYMLDTVASLAAVRAVDACENDFLNQLKQTLRVSAETVVLSYSPGYCGWHISGQKKLFESLKPEQIGITLNDSFLMIPLKSATGILVAGKKEIHIFDDHFSFCQQCKNRSCRERIRKIKSKE